MQAKDIEITPRDVLKDKPLNTRNLKFGDLFTDHMLVIDYNANDGWSKPKIMPYGPMKMAVSATSLHYGISCFEGMNVVKNSET